MALTAADLFAFSQGSCNNSSGFWKCHWCGSDCSSEFTHNDVAPIPFFRTKTSAKQPSQPYQCVGCWLWQRPLVTTHFLGGGWKDRQTAKNHSWWITREEAKAIKPGVYKDVW